MNLKRKHLVTVFLMATIMILFGYQMVAYGQGLEGLESGVRRGTSVLQKFGLAFGSFMFVIGAIFMKFDADKGKQILLCTAVGVIFLTVGTSLPESIRGYFN